MKPLIWGAVAGLVIGGAGWLSAKAHADPPDPIVTHYTTIVAPIICEALDEHPNLKEVEIIMDSIMDVAGFTVDQSAAVVVLSVNGTCPRFLPLLREFADSGKASVTA